MMFLVLWIIFPISVEGTGPYMRSVGAVFAFFLLEWILLQGTLYWYLKWRNVKKTGQSALSQSWLKLFRGLKRINLALIAVGLLALVQLLFTFPQGAYWFLVVYGFAIAEQINYYHIRLSYQTPEEIKEFTRQKGFRPSILAKELRRNDKAM